MPECHAEERDAAVDPVSLAFRKKKVQAALAKSKRIITRVTEEAVREVPLAVEQILKVRAADRDDENVVCLVGS
eukprot:scaffold492_cov257-Pinguiococcus_pyrenoidosus.AAC.34